MNWTIILLKNETENIHWYVSYMESKLLSQIDSLNLSTKVKVLVFNDMQEFKSAFNKINDGYINIISYYEDVSDNYVSTVYNKLKYCVYNCVGIRGVYYYKNTPFVFNQVSEKYSNEEEYLPPSWLTPIRKSFISNNLEDYVNNNFSKLLTIKTSVEQPVVFTQHRVIVELPSDDQSSGGIKRMLRLAIELPNYSTTCGGITETIKLANNLSSNVLIRFQKITHMYPQISNQWTVGLPDHTFPACDVCVTYSDNPYLSNLVALPKVKKVLLYMLSYGMVIERERKNVLTPNVTVMCSTKKLEKAISAEGVKVHRIGFALDMDEMYNMHLERKNYLAIMYHPSDDKKYDLAVSVANQLFDEKKISGVITFGTNLRYSEFKHPKGLAKHVANASRDEIREIFNSCKCFLMPSVSEGLNLTPIESALCGCPAIICDGAIGEVFFNNENCILVNKNDANEMLNKSKFIIDNFNYHSDKFAKKMESIVRERTWDKVITNLYKLI